MIEALKCLHLLFVLSLLGTALYTVFLLFRHHKTRLPTQWIMSLAIGALITGALLVRPRHFTFHTPWIQAAFILLSVFLAGILLLHSVTLTKKMAFFLWVILFTLLIFITHDAVNKETILPSFFQLAC